jgi:tryptophanyl-tRNA synthetase
MSPRPLKWGGNPRVQRVVPVFDGGDAATSAQPGAEGGDGKMSKNQLKKLEKERQVAAKKAAKEKAKAESAAEAGGQ